MIRVMAVTNENQIFDRDPVSHHEGGYPTGSYPMSEQHMGDHYAYDYAHGYDGADLPMPLPLEIPDQYRDLDYYLYSYPDYYPDYPVVSPYWHYSALYPYSMYYQPFFSTY